MCWEFYFIGVLSLNYMGWFSFIKQIYIRFLRSLAQAHFESNLHTWFLMDPSVLSPHQLSNSECSRTKTIRHTIMTLSWVGLKSLLASLLWKLLGSKKLCRYHPGKRVPTFSSEKREGAINSLRQYHLTILYKCLTSLMLTDLDNGLSSALSFNNSILRFVSGKYK